MGADDAYVSDSQEGDDAASEDGTEGKPTSRGGKSISASFLLPHRITDARGLGIIPSRSNRSFQRYTIAQREYPLCYGARWHKGSISFVMVPSSMSGRQSIHLTTMNSVSRNSSIIVRSIAIHKSLGVLQLPTSHSSIPFVVPHTPTFQGGYSRR